MNNPSGSGAIARFACDFCKGKKIKCSRELPKCAACKAWPGPCHYSRQPPKPDVPRLEPSSSTRAIRAQYPDPNSIPARLDRIEATLETLTSAINSLLAAPTSRVGQEPVPVQTRSTSNDSGTELQSSSAQPGAGSSSPITDCVPSHLSSLDEATAHLSSSILSGATSQAEYGLAVTNLKDLVDALTSFRLDSSLDLPTEPGSRRYIIPDAEVGYAMMTRFMSLSGLYSTFFEIPSDEVLEQVIFRPSDAPAGWVVFVNYCLLASPNTKPDAGLANMLRWNALALHKPGLELDEESRQRQLTLFWVIFKSEKFCTLAFGRPPLLPVSLYRDVELPSFDYLTRVTPHLDGTHRDATDVPRSTFGAYIFLRNVELARLTGEILDYLAMDKPRGELATLMAMLDAWYNETREMFCSKVACEEEVLDAQKATMRRLFEFTVRFRYLHTRLILTKDCLTHRATRVDWARQAIEILHNTVSTWDPIYNGIIWHLLYYPFTPFFVLFGYIIQNPGDLEVEADLQLLSMIVAYFISLQSRLTLLGKTGIVGGSLMGVVVNSSLPQENETAGSLPDGHQPEPASERTHGNPFYDTSLDDIDIGKFISWLPEPLMEGFPSQGTNEPVQGNQDSLGTVPQAPRGQKRPFDTTFDWFSWENYYSDL
ncbi:hypothetical protein MFIFM68171_07805 [Madurella fahalii]|uniref:Zn(2)-C6 fungal-type domain-containing protein n=1 Tax=Madurella fahalii TaxID=1157608 RepID=A0ABQ0GJ79_9PEZI